MQHPTKSTKLCLGTGVARFLDAPPILARLLCDRFNIHCSLLRNSFTTRDFIAVIAKKVCFSSFLQFRNDSSFSVSLVFLCFLHHCLVLSDIYHIRAACQSVSPPHSKNRSMSWFSTCKADTRNWCITYRCHSYFWKFFKNTVFFSILNRF